MKSLRVILLALSCAVPLAAVAQWQWIDKDGRKVFSDQPPPPSVPANKILRQPGARVAPAAEEAVGTASAPATGAQTAKASASAPKLTGKEKELEDKKKAAEAAEAAKKKALEDEVARLRADNCERAKRSKATFNTGVPIARTNAKGEREIMDDATRAAEIKRIDALIASDCKPAGG
jgi:hypothetical protein